MMHDENLMLILVRDPDACASAFRTLDRAGYRLTSCRLPQDAVRVVAERQPTVVLSDLTLESLDMTEEIKAMAPSTAVVLVGDRADWPLYDEAIKAGADDVLTRPLAQDDLLRTLVRVAPRTTA